MARIDLDNGPSGNKALLVSMTEGVHSAKRRQFPSIAVILSIAIGSALALAVSATGRGTEDTVTDLLTNNPAASQLDLGRVFDVLGDARTLLTSLAAFFTVVLVTAVNIQTKDERRREIRIKTQRGIHVWEILTELMTEALLLSIIGAVLGTVLGIRIAEFVPTLLPALNTRVIREDMVLVGAIVIALGTSSLLLVGLILLRGQLWPFSRRV